ncbi:MAG: tyrosine--tRNA ligase [Planctomycetota bacterium]|nr:tyrosine--tRNA ligase [Planctomycetota bacterium]
MTDLLAELRFRGLFHQTTDEAGLRAHLGSATRPGGRRGYCGFDPTADSLTIGNLVPIIMLRHLQRSGHTPVVVMGGGTGLIGDPSGKSTERQLQSEERVRANVESQRRIFERLLSFEGPNAAVIVNNLDWLGKLGFIEALRDVGKHFSINEMIKRDSVRDRLENREQGISYTEFSYMLLQAYDYLHLYRTMGVTLQLSGSDQWSNIVPGIDLIRRWENAAHAGGRPAEAESAAFGLTAPLVTKADGTKFGKTESGAIWLSPERTSPYAFFQFWLNAADADVRRWIRFFTFLPHEEILALEAAHDADPGRREAHRALARHMTTLLHGERAAADAERAAAALFSGDVADLPLSTLEEVFAAVPASDHRREELAALGPAGMPLAELLPLTSLCKSKREAREHLQAGAVSINGRVAGPDDSLRPDDLLHGTLALIRRGKKAWHLTRWT